MVCPESETDTFVDDPEHNAQHLSDDMPYHWHQNDQNAWLTLTKLLPQINGFLDLSTPILLVKCGESVAKPSMVNTLGVECYNSPNYSAIDVYGWVVERANSVHNV